MDIQTEPEYEERTVREVRIGLISGTVLTYMLNPIDSYDDQSNLEAILITLKYPDGSDEDILINRAAMEWMSGREFTQKLPIRKAVVASVSADPAKRSESALAQMRSPLGVGPSDLPSRAQE